MAVLPPRPQPCVFPYSQCLDLRPNNSPTSLTGLGPPAPPRARFPPLHFCPCWSPYHRTRPCSSGPPLPERLGTPRAYLACSASHYHLGCVLAERHLLHAEPRVIAVGVKAAHLGNGMER